jgi:hypothetical protein
VDAPLITRRSSSRGTPRTSVRRYGAMRAHCASLSQKKLLRTMTSKYQPSDSPITLFAQIN